MKPELRRLVLRLALAAGVAASTITSAHADAVTDWNLRSADIVTESKLGTPPAVRVMALVQSAVHGAVHAIAPQGPAPRYAVEPAPAASADAAVAAAHRAVFARLLPAQ